MTTLTESPTKTSKVPKLIWYKDELLHLKILLVTMGALVIAFNVKGYEILFNDTPFVFKNGMSPFSLLLAVTEIAVLVWTSAVISKWPIVSRILKSLLIFVVLAFGFLSYSGINSYLSALATSDIKKVQEVKNVKKNNEEMLQTYTQDIESNTSELSKIRAERERLNIEINGINEEIKITNLALSERRKTHQNCSLVKDCIAALEPIQEQAKRLSKELSDRVRDRDRISDRIISFEDKQDELTKLIQDQKRKDISNLNEHAGTEALSEQKRKSYEALVLKVTSWLGFIPVDPFGVFVSFIAFLIYPVYFMLNLYIGLNSKENTEVRNERIKHNKNKKRKSKEKKSIREAILRSISGYIRASILRKKKMLLLNLNDKKIHNRKRKSGREKTYKRLIKYFRVWALRRTKTKEITIETIVEKVVETEVEKIIEVEVQIEVEKVVEVIKEIPIEVRVEVPVEVDRIVKVPTEVPVYIEKIKKIPEPVFIKDPQIIIHERVIPVPENISAADLEILLNAQPELNENARDAEKTVVLDNEREGVEETTRERGGNTVKQEQSA